MYRIQDAQARHAAYPDTFELPDPEDIHRLAAGDHVKLMFENTDGQVERMWVLVDFISPKAFSMGTLDDRPATMGMPMLGDQVQFRWQDVIQILRASDPLP